jgi:hypothetical protein
MNPAFTCDYRRPPVACVVSGGFQLSVTAPSGFVEDSYRLLGRRAHGWRRPACSTVPATSRWPRCTAKLCGRPTRPSMNCTIRCTAPRCRADFRIGAEPTRSCSSPRPPSNTPVPTRRSRSTSRAAVGHRLAGAFARVWGRPRWKPTRHPRHPVHNRQHRLRAAHCPHGEGTRQRRRLVVIQTGGRPLDTLPLPGNARAATYLPYDKFLPRTTFT